MAEKIGEAYVEAIIRLGKLRSGLRQAERMVTSSVAKMQRSLNTLSARVGMGGAGGIAGRGAGGLLGAGVAGGVVAGLLRQTQAITAAVKKTKTAFDTAGFAKATEQWHKGFDKVLGDFGKITKATKKADLRLLQYSKTQKRFEHITKAAANSLREYQGLLRFSSPTIKMPKILDPFTWNQAQKAAGKFYQAHKAMFKETFKKSWGSAQKIAGATYRVSAKKQPDFDFYFKQQSTLYYKQMQQAKELEKAGMMRSGKAYNIRQIQSRIAHLAEAQGRLNKKNAEYIKQMKTLRRAQAPTFGGPGGVGWEHRNIIGDDPERFKRSKKMARAAARQREQDALREKRMKAEWKALEKQYKEERKIAKTPQERRRLIDKTHRVIKARADLRKRQEVIEHLKAVKDWKIAATRRKLAAKDLFERRPGLFPKGVSTEQKPWVVDRRRKEANRWEKERRLSELMNAQKALKQQKAIWDKQATARKKFNKLDLPSGMGAARYDAYDALKGRPQYKPTAPSWQKPGVIPGAPGRLKALQQYGKAMKEIHELERRAAKPVGYIRGMGKALHQMPKDFGSFLAVGKKAMRGIKIAAGGMWGSFKKIGSGFGGWFKKIKAGFFGSTSGAQEFLKKLGMLKWIGIAALGAIARQTLISAMRFEAMRGSLDGLAGSAENAKNILYHMNRGLRGTVAAVDLVQQANSALLLGLPASAEKMGQLATISRRLSRAMGIDVKHGFASFVTGIGRQSRMLLDNLGIIVDTNQAYTIYAKKLGKAASQLTEVEKKQAFFNAALEAGAMRVEKMGEDVAYNIGTFEKLGATSKDAGLSLAGLVLQYGPLFWMMKRVDDGSQKMRTSLYRANNEIDRSSGVITKHLAELGRLNKKTAEYIMLLAQQRKWQAEIRKEHEALKVTQHEGRIRAIDRETQRLQTRFDSIARVQDERDRAITAYYDNYFRRLGERLEREKVIEERLADIYVRAAQRKLEKEKEFRSMIESEQEKHLKNTGKNKQAEYLVIKRHYDKLAKEHRNNKKVLQTIEEWRQAAIRNMFKKKEKAFQSEMLGPTGLWEKAMTISLSESEQKTMVKLNESQLSELVLIKAGIDSLISQGKDLDLDE